MTKAVKKNMLLTFRSNMTGPEEEKDKIEFITRAEFVKQNNKYYVTFCDTEALGNESQSKRKGHHASLRCQQHPIYF